MIDGVKIIVTYIGERAEKYNSLDFKTVFNDKTGEIKKEYAVYKTLTIRKIRNSNNALIIGSIHKFFNEWKGVKPTHSNNGYNGNSFSLHNILEVRDYFSDFFDTTPAYMIFQNLEIGLNLDVNFNPNDFLKGLLYHKGVKFDSKSNHTYKYAEHSNYIVKCYNKSLISKIDIDNKVRFEVKIKRSEDIRTITNINTFQDVNTDTLKKSKQYLIKRLDEVVYYDYTINKENLNQKDVKLLDKYKDVNYWFELNTNRRDRPKKKLNYFISDYSDNLKEQIITKIKNYNVIDGTFEEMSYCVIVTNLNIDVNNTQKSLIVKNRNSKNNILKFWNYLKSLILLIDKSLRYLMNKENNISI